MISISHLTIKAARQALQDGVFSSRELTEATLNSIAEKDSQIHAFLEVFDDALLQADECDKKIKAGISLPLLGIPLAIKDNMLVKDKRVSAGSKILEHFVAPVDGTAVSRLREAGAVIVGRTNMDEFAMGSSTENSAYGTTRNPHDLERVAGGTSGGSAAAVAAGMCVGAFGSDTGGSVRQPASFCGVVGLKPTYGRISRSGLIAMTSSFDQIGPMTKTVEDNELLYSVVKGVDPMDSTSIKEDTYPYQKDIQKIIGIPEAYVNSEGVKKEIKENLQTAIEKFESLGYKVVNVELPSLAYALAAYYIIMPAEASSNLSRFDGVKYGLHVEGKDSIDDYFKTRGVGFGKEVRKRIILGTYVLSSGYYDAYYGNALLVRQKIREELQSAFQKVDAILMPTTPGPAWKLGEKSKDPLDMYLEDIFTIHANVSGCPAISLPSGFVEVEGKKLPLGIELTADLGREDILFNLGKEFLGE